MTNSRNKRQRAYANRRDYEGRVRAAVTAYQQEEKRSSDGKPKSLRDIASEHGVNHVTLSRRCRGQLSLSEAREKTQAISSTQAEIIIQYLERRGDRGMPLTLDALRDVAQEVINSQTPDGKVPHKLGINWPSRFIDKHIERISMYWSRPMDTKRGKAVNPISNKQYWNIIGPVLANAKPENIYGMDETGVQLGYSTRQRVIGAKGKRVQHLQSDASKEMVTVIVTICADGTAIPPTAIYKGVYFLERWLEQENPANMS